MPIYSYSYSFPYLLVALILFFLYKKEMRNVNNFKNAACYRNVAFFLMLIFIGLRGHLHNDFATYYLYFDKIPNIFNLSINTFTDTRPLFEPGFIFYTSLCKTLVNNYFVWVFINTLIDLCVFRAIFKKICTSQILPFFFLLVYHGLALEFNYYRTAKSFDLFLLSIPFLLQRRFKAYCFINLLGSLFHSSSILYILFYPLLSKKISIKAAWGLVIVVNVLYWGNIHVTTSLINMMGIFGNDFIFNKLISYQESGLAYKFSFGYFERTFSILLSICLYDRLLEKNKNNYLVFNCLLLYYCVHLFFSDVFVLAERISVLFAFSYWLIYTNIFNLKFKFRQIIVLFVVLLSLSKITIGCNNITNYYDNVLWGTMSYDRRVSNLESWAISEL